MIRIQDNKARYVGAVTAKVVPDLAGAAAGEGVERRPGESLRASAVSRSFGGVQALSE